MGDDSDVHRARDSSAARASMSAASTGDRGARGCEDSNEAPRRRHARRRAARNGPMRDAMARDYLRMAI